MGRKIISDFQLKKCEKKEWQLDRISQLPDEILVCILSFLSLEAAARTSLLSKRWAHLWLSVASLDFESAKLLKGIEGLNLLLKSDREIRRGYRQKYVDWVNKVIQSRRDSVLDVFRIHYHLDKSFGDDIDKWLQYAFAKRVQRLSLDLLQLDYEMSYAFPCHLFGLSDGNGSSLSVSASRANHINSDVLFGLKTLRALTFSCVNVSGGVLEFFLHNCPFLEYMLVDSSGGLKELKVVGPSLALKHLVIIYCAYLLSLVVRDTNIVSLTTTSGYSLVLENVPMLVDVHVAGTPTGTGRWSRANFVEKAISWISCCLSKLEALTLELQDWQVEYMHDWQLEVAKKRETNAELPQLTKLKQLTLSVSVPRKRSLIAFTSLIRASPNLEKFVMKSVMSRTPRKEWPRKIRRASIVGVPHEHLKVVEFWGHYGRRLDVEILDYFVKNSVALEKVVVDPRDRGYLDNRPRGDYFDEEDPVFKNSVKQGLRAFLPDHVELVFL
ncbi:OLC1v1006117C1 [Oldenlandia corymbosa var. corymbosa]|uniref:OLC1v1006117C1 n=1 Tax=Oldenlandia corymbosa var. corymbosa TaxID=529605 RepID=A0AAV1DJ87_OLDCO|nr:OLC1v1006117C1 [Oldenlandia corymbosa var. corymbosa]